MRVLFVDDEPEVVDIMRRRFERKRYDFFGAGNITEALTVFAENEIDVLITDLKMPGGTGLDLLAAIKQTGRKEPAAILLTGSTSQSATAMAREAGFEAVIEKPISTSAVIRAAELCCADTAQGTHQRTGKRINIDSSVQVYFDKTGKVMGTALFDISERGCFLIVDEKEVFPEINDHVQFKIALKNSEGDIVVVDGLGVVRWTRPKWKSEQKPAGVGIEFLDISRSFRESIISLINEKSTDELSESA